MNRIESMKLRIAQRISIAKECSDLEKEYLPLKSLREDTKKIKTKLVRHLKVAIRALEIINNRL